MQLFVFLYTYENCYTHQLFAALTIILKNYRLLYLSFVTESLKTFHVNFSR